MPPDLPEGVVLYVIEDRPENNMLAICLTLEDAKAQVELSHPRFGWEIVEWVVRKEEDGIIRFKRGRVLEGKWYL